MDNLDKKTPKKGMLSKNQKMVLKALERSMGNITIATKKTKIARSTFYHWLNENPEFRRRAEEISDIVLDWAESELYKQIESGNTTSLIFFLKCRGKSRGWIEKPIDTSQPKEEPIQLTEKAQKMLEDTRKKMTLVEGITNDELETLIKDKDGA